MFEGLSTELKIVIVLYLATWVACGLLSWRYRKRLRTVAPEVAARIAKRLGTNSVSSDWQGLLFLLRRQYRDLGDARLTSYGDGTRLAYLAMLLLMLVFAVLLFLHIRGG